MDQKCLGKDLREQLRNGAYPSGSGWSRQIVPIGVVEEVLKVDVIISLLHCRCKKNRRWGGISESEAIGYASRILGNPPGPEVYRAIRLLALLILVKGSHLIIDLVVGGILDPKFDQLPSIQGIVEENLSTYLPSAEEVERSSKRIVQDICDERWKLNSPVLESGLYEKFDKDIIMPFSQIGGEIGRGSSGVVYKLEIHPSHQKIFTDKNQPKPQFARKVLKSTYGVEFESEKNNLEFIQRLENDHLIKIIKTYQHGEELNFLFPLADGNLHEYLENPPPADDVVGSLLQTHWLWEQLAGIADALHSISYSTEGGEWLEGSYRSWSGCHLDLKPSNILITNKGGRRTLVITDFGLAYFTRLNEDANYSSVPLGWAGSMYAPPDGYINPNTKISRSFDVWSFGCILLEAAVYIIHGKEGHQELDKFREARRVPTCSNYADAKGTTLCFYMMQPEISRSEFTLKKAVFDQIESLKSQALQHTFVNGIMELVEKTLKDQKTRIKMGEVSGTLQQLLTSAIWVVGAKAQELCTPYISAEMEQAKNLSIWDDYEIIGHGMLDMMLKYTFSNSNNNQWFDCQVELGRNKKLGLIKIHTSGREALLQMILDPKLLLLDPLYVLSGPKTSRQVGFKGFNLCYQFNDMKDLIRFQSVIINQNILIDLEVAKISIKEIGRANWRNDKEKEELIQERGPECGLRIQLWSPHPLSLSDLPNAPQSLRSFDTSSGSSGAPRNSSDNDSSRRGATSINTSGSSTSVRSKTATRPPRSAPTPTNNFFRIVIYLKNEILIIRVSDSSNIIREKGKLHVQPYKGKSFLAYRIDSPEGELPGIPICGDVLDTQDDQAKKIAHIHISFPKRGSKKESAAESFVRIYNDVWDKLAAEAKAKSARVALNR